MAVTQNGTKVTSLIGFPKSAAIVLIELRRRARHNFTAESWIVVLLALFFALVARQSNADTVSSRKRVLDLLPSTQPDWGADLSGPMCGIFAACTAVELVGLSASPGDYIASRYVAGCSGSSADELAEIVTQAGGRARIVAKLSAFDLRAICTPVICNVRNQPATSEFNHWVTVLPGKSGVIVYDGLQDSYEISTAEFLGCWNGIGVCVSKEDDNPLALMWLSRSTVCLTFGTALILSTRRFRGGSGSVRQLGTVLLTSAIFSVVGNTVFGDLRNHAAGVAVATAPTTSKAYRTGTLDDAIAASKNESALLVDARHQKDYDRGTIDGAVNIPVTASAWAVRQYVNNLDRDTQIVVFCQSAQCTYDESVGAQLVSMRFRNVIVCNEGWREYSLKAATAGQDIDPKVAR